MTLRAAAVLAGVLILNACGGGGGGPSGPITATGSVRGNVNDQTGAPVPSASVALRATGQTTRNATTGADGSYSFGSVTPGAYTIAVTPPSGFQLGGSTGTTAVTVVAGQQASATIIVLQRNPSTGPAPAQAFVSMVNSTFEPVTVEVAVGGFVTWTNNDNQVHNASGTGVNTGNINPGANSGPQEMRNAGTFPYNCTIHSGMSGTIIVR